MVTILVSVTTFVFESMTGFNSTPSACATHLSVENCEPEPHPAFYAIEVVCVVIFTVDYLIRIALSHSAISMELTVPAARAPISADGEFDILSTLSSKPLPPARTTWKYALQPLNIIDLLAIAPFYLELASPGSDMLAVTRVFRLFRLCRLFKAPKIRLCAEMFVDVVFDALPALMTLFFVSTLMCVLFASVLVFAESSWYSLDFAPDEYPKGVYVRPTVDGYSREVSPFTSVPYAFWWFFVTTTTVGYGDDYPTTTSGRIVAIFAFYLGIVLLALPLSIVGQSFNKFYPDWVKDFEGTASEEEMDERIDEGTETASACSFTPSFSLPPKSPSKLAPPTLQIDENDLATAFSFSPSLSLSQKASPQLTTPHAQEADSLRIVAVAGSSLVEKIECSDANLTDSTEIADEAKVIPSRMAWE